MPTTRRPGRSRKRPCFAVPHDWMKLIAVAVEGRQLQSVFLKHIQELPALVFALQERLQFA